MRCPQCKSENRDERAACYHCGQDLSALSHVLNRVRNHFNTALEHAERGRNEEALRELQNAVDLDASFVDAWVVMGTIYAKEEKFDDAKRAWNQALSLDRRFLKCHEYLEKGEAISPQLPAIRNLRNLAAISMLSLAVVVVAAVSIIAIQNRPDPAMNGVQAALDFVDENELGSALGALGEAADEPLAPASSRRVAATLHIQLEDRLEDDLAKIRIAAASGSPGETLDAVQGLAQLHPPAEIAHELQAIRVEALETMLASARAEFVRYENREITHAEFETWAEGSVELLEGNDRGEQILALLTKAKSVEADRQFDRFRRETRQIEDLVELAAKVDECSRSFPDRKAQCEEVLEHRISIEGEKTQLALDDAIASEDLAAAELLLIELKSLYGKVGRTAPEQVVDAKVAAIEKVRKDKAFAEVRQQYETDDHAGTLARLAEIESADWSNEQREHLTMWRDESERALATELWNWSQSLDQQFEDGRISRDDARRMVRHYGLILARAPKAERRYRATHTLFRTASAYLKLDQPEQAVRLVEEMKQKYPKAAVLRYRAFKRFEKRLAQELEGENAGSKAEKLALTPPPGESPS